MSITTDTQSWQKGQPPKDGKTYIVVASIQWAEAARYNVTPLLIKARFDWKLIAWLDEDGLPIISFPQETLIFHHWINQPQEA